MDRSNQIAVSPPAATGWWSSGEPAPNDERHVTLVRVIVSVVMMALAWMLPSWALVVPGRVFLSVHTLLEVLPMVVAAAVFAIGWESARHQRPRPLLILATGFLGVAVLDGLHLLSEPGMPEFFTGSPGETTALLWLGGRALAAGTLLLVAFLRWESRVELRHRWLWLAGALTASLLLALLGLIPPAGFPRLSTDADGPVAFRLGVELVIVCVYAGTGLVFWRRTEPSEALELARLGAACWALAMAELFLLTAVRGANTVPHLLGHLYTGMAYVLIYSSVIRQGIRDPWDRVSASEKRLELAVREKSTILDSVTVGVCFVRDGRFVLVNRAFEEMLGRASAELVGQSTERVDPSGAAFEADGRTGEVSAKVELKHRSGRRLLTSVRGKALEPSGPDSGSIWCVDDITEHEAADTRLSQALLDASQHAECLEEINQMNEWLLACRSESEAWPVVTRAAGRLFSSRGYVAVEREDLGLLEVAASWGTWGDQLPRAFLPDACWGVRRGQPHEARPPDELRQCQHLAALPAGGFVCVPLQVQGRGLGLLHLECPSGEASSLQAWRRLVDTFAASIKSTLSNLRLRTSLHEQATHDALTGLFNRRSLDEALPRELHRAQRNHSTLSVAMVDVDHFKALNDTHGHVAGDVVLETLGRMLRENLRFSDLACRFGGEEFAVVMPATSTAQARSRLDELRQLIAGFDFQHLGRSLGPLTVSIGIAQAPDHGSTRDELLRQADQALYLAKTNGRNRTCVAGEVVAAAAGG